MRLRFRWPLRRRRDKANTPVARPTPTTLDTVDWTRWYPALIWFAAGVVAVTFALSYHGLYEFSAKVAYLPTPLAIAAPIGVDVFSLCCLTATFLLRDAHWRVRTYSWVLFAITVIISVAGNAVYAIDGVERRAGVSLDQLSWSYQQVAAVVGSAVWPAFAAGALHLLIIGRRHLERQRDSVRQVAAEVDQAAAEEQLLRARAIELAASGATAAAIVSDLGLDESKQRTVERWTKPIRDALSAARSAAPANGGVKTTTARRTRSEGASS